LREEAGGLDHDVDTEVAPREVCRVALLHHGDGLTADDDLVALERHLCVETTRDRVVLEEVSEGCVVRQVVDRDDLEVAALCEGGAEVVAADAAEAVDADFDAHGDSCLTMPR